MKGRGFGEKNPEWGPFKEEILPRNNRYRPREPWVAPTDAMATLMAPAGCRDNFLPIRVARFRSQVPVRPTVVIFGY